MHTMSKNILHPLSKRALNIPNLYSDVKLFESKKQKKICSHEEVVVQGYIIYDNSIQCQAPTQDTDKNAPGSQEMRPSSEFRAPGPPHLASAKRLRPARNPISTPPLTPDFPPTHPDPTPKSTNLLSIFPSRRPSLSRSMSRTSQHSYRKRV